MHSHSESAYGRICYKQPLHSLWLFFWDEPFLYRLYEIYLSIKDLENFAEFNLLQNLHLCIQKSVCATNLGPLGEIGASFSPQLSSRTQFAEIINKKIITENQCEKHKNRVKETLASEQWYIPMRL